MTERDLLKAMLVTALSAAAVCVVAALAMGCSERAEARGYASQSVVDHSRVYTHTPRGTQVGFPYQLALHHPAMVDECLLLIDSTTADVDPRYVYDTTTPGIPAPYVVEVYQSGWFPTEASSTGFAAGQTSRHQRTIHLALRRGSDPKYPLLPALGHELAHVQALYAGVVGWRSVGH